MTGLILLALIAWVLIVWRGMDKVKDGEFLAYFRVALTALVVLILAYVAMRLVPPEQVPSLLQAALRALKA